MSPEPILARNSSGTGEHVCSGGRGCRGHGQREGVFCLFRETCSFPKLQLPSFGASFHEILGVREHLGQMKLVF